MIFSLRNTKPHQAGGTGLAGEGACVPGNKMIMRIVCSFLFVICFFVFAYGQSSEINVIPKPRSIERNSESFRIDRSTIIIPGANRSEAELLRDIISSRYGLNLKIGAQPRFPPKATPNSIDLARWNRDREVNHPEGYVLAVQATGIWIEGADAAGNSNALRSLIQLLPTNGSREILVPGVRIGDWPRFPYRGMHLDTARHFMPVSFVKRYIDLMSQYKFNQFHWHLTDDQGWRIEIKKYPRLTEIGSKRPESHEGVYSTVFKGDGRPVEGFYTQGEIRDVVAYAKARYINVIPEIELPGHASAALAAYPEFGCKAEYKYEVKKTWGIFKEVFCPTDATFKFLEDVLDETIKLFPDSPYIHVGGDEVLKDFWKESPFVQDLMKRENLKDEHEVQSYFIRRIEKHINKRGKKIIGWDEILEGGLAPNATVMSWRGMKGGIDAAKAKHDVIMTPTDFSYFDYGQGDPAYEPLNIGGYLPLEKVYSFEPVPKELTADEAKYIIGAQANIWTEYLETPAAVEYMAFPRMLALAEVAWSRPESKDFADFYRRLKVHLPRLDAQNVNYRIPEPMPVGAFLLGEKDARGFEIKSPVPGGKVLFTRDGSNPTEKSPEAPSRFVANPEGSEILTLKTIVVLPNGRKSSVYAATFLRGTMREPVTLGETKPGVTYEFFIPRGDMSGEGERRAGESRSIFLTQFAQGFDLKKDFAVTFDGYVKAPLDGVYEFLADSTWDTTVVLGGTMIINDAGTAERKIRSAIVPLRAGWHKVSLRYNHRGGEAHFRIRFGLKGQGLRQIGGGEMVH